MSEILMENENLRKVSRSFVVTLASSEEVYNFFSEKVNDGDFSFLRFILGKKTSKEKGGDRLTFFGGKINEENEDLLEAAQREVVEEIGLTFIPIGNLRKLMRRSTTLHNLGSFSYQYGEIQREVILNAFYVDPESISLIGDQKISEFLILNLKQLKGLIFGEEIDGLKLEEHLRLDIGSGGRFFISDEDYNNRREIFDKSLKWFEHIDGYLKRRFKAIFEQNPGITLEEFKLRYEQEIVRFMREGLRLSLPNKKIEENVADKIKNREARVIYEGLNGGFLGNDVLYYLPHIAHLVIEGVDPEKVLRSSTETTLNFWQYFKGIYDDFLRNNEIFDEKKYESLITLGEKSYFILEFTKFVEKRLQQDFGLTDEEIRSTFSHFNGFWSELEQDLKNADLELTKGLVQNYRLLNEVANAPLGRLILIFLGKERYKADDLSDEERISMEKIQKKLIFEAGRQLLLLMKGFLSVSYFEKRSQPDNMIKVNSAIENYFGRPIDVSKIEDKGDKVLVEIRKDPEGNYFIVDEKPGKRWISFLRKSFKEKPEDIIDFSSYSIVYLGDDKNDKEEFIESLINGNFENNFLQFLREQFQNSEITLKRKSTFGINNFVENSKQLDGKRTGSQAKRILAQKYILDIDGQKTEIVVYPFLSTVEEGVDDDGFWMGWLEKRKDDPDYVVRRMLAGENGFPSFYDLLFPPEIYPDLYEYRLQATYHL